MTKSALSSVLFLLCCPNAAAFSLSMGSESRAAASDIFGSRRSFLSKSVATAVVGGTSIFSQPQPSLAVTAKEIITTPAGVKYAVTQEPTDKKPAAPLKGDIVAIDYKDIFLMDRSSMPPIREEKNNALLFKLGSGSVIPGLDDVVAQMVVGQKVQAIIPPSLAYGEKGVCLDDGECLIKPGSTLVYDVFLKRSSIPPP
eukprot:CAMPEP_0181116084 /NCGR_PEP_ID=MMETSP1071-20121207/21764_1 /TAXON_ID=35127 /ORGANISM="Thalassiosira sp., Strain NH16" /LENGTH=198 /DNA_ID=CAMNT_0023200309 /DNA_START=15 /DNA_END=612 /DNA_ORIENTATION=+